MGHMHIHDMDGYFAGMSVSVTYACPVPAEAIKGH